MSRKDDLERLIRNSYDIIRQYEETVQTPDQPKGKARARRNIEEKWGLVKDYLAEYQTLGQRLGRLVAEDILEIAVRFEAGGTVVLGDAAIEDDDPVGRDRLTGADKHAQERNGPYRAEGHREREKTSLRTQLEAAQDNLSLSASASHSM